MPPARLDIMKMYFQLSTLIWSISTRLLSKTENPSKLPMHKMKIWKSFFWSVHTLIRNSLICLLGKELFSFYGDIKPVLPIEGIFSKDWWLYPWGWLLWKTNLSERNFQGNSVDARTKAQPYHQDIFHWNLHLICRRLYMRSFISFVERDAP